MKKCIVCVWMFLCAVCMFATDLQVALKETATQFSSSLRSKSVVAIVGIYSESNDLSEFMLDELTAHFIKLKTLTVADRFNLDAIKKEMSFQMSGEVGDESIQQLGAKIGAETVIQGVLKQFGDVYNLTIRALNVTTAAITDMYRTNVELDKTAMSMLTGKGKGVSVAKKGMAREKKVRSAAAMVGFQNLFFGLGSYLKGHYGDGAFLTTTYAISRFVLLGGGIGMLLDIHTELGGVICVSLFPFVELFAIIYGSVVPYYYDEVPSIFASDNRSGLKFDLALGPKGQILPQVSYVLRLGGGKSRQEKLNNCEP